MGHALEGLVQLVSQGWVGGGVGGEEGGGMETAEAKRGRGRGEATCRKDREKGPGEVGRQQQQPVSGSWWRELTMLGTRAIPIYIFSKVGSPGPTSALK